MRAVFDQAHDIRNRNRALGRNDKGNIGLVFVFRTIGIEIVIKQDRNFTRQNTCIGGLFWHNRIVCFQLFEKLDPRREIVKGTAHSPVDRHRTGITDKGA